jgi:hypothetical protein
MINMPPRDAGQISAEKSRPKFPLRDPPGDEACQGERRNDEEQSGAQDGKRFRHCVLPRPDKNSLANHFLLLVRN